jgi:hypothetical protein
VANGDRVTSPGCCRNLSVSISNEQFIIDCYGLSISSYDMVLGVQWLESLGPVMWDFDSRTIAIVRNGHHVLWTVVCYYRHFIKDYGATVAPLTQLLRKDSFRWSAEAAATF